VNFKIFTVIGLNCISMEFLFTFKFKVYFTISLRKREITCNVQVDDFGNFESVRPCNIW
jgi:hypothetical protein